MSKILISLLLGITLCSQLVFADESIENLLAQGKLTLSLSVNNHEQQIVGQALIVSIEVSTDRWFAKGSKVQPFTLTNVVMQANNINTINGSESIKGKSWATQTHEITLYPTREGSYLLPEITVDVSVNTENDGVISGELLTNETEFIITLPDELIGIDSFIVSPKVTLSIDGLFETEKEYVVGEAITQTITMTASDTPSMMIPELNLTASKTSALDGISIYHKPAKILDKSNRGSLTGSRVESYTYIFEKPGSYELDEKIIYWWNNQSNTLESLIIPSSVWTVKGSGLPSTGQKTSLLGDIKFNVDTIIRLVFLSLLFAAAYLIYKNREFINNLYKKMTHFEQRQLRAKFFIEITNKNYLLATQFLFQYAVLKKKEAEMKTHPLTHKLNQVAFDVDDNVDSYHKPISRFSSRDAQTLIEQIDATSNQRNKTANFIPKEPIKLNED